MGDPLGYQDATSIDETRTPPRFYTEPPAGTKYCLHYFKYKGFAEGIRMLLTYLGEEFMENLVDPYKEGWEKMPVGYERIQRYMRGGREWKMRQFQTDIPMTWISPMFEVMLPRERINKPGQDPNRTWERQKWIPPKIDWDKADELWHAMAKGIPVELQYNPDLIVPWWMFEPAAIGQYLAETHPDADLVPEGPLKRAQAINMANFWVADLHGAFQMYQAMIDEDERNVKWKDWLDGFLHPRLKKLDAEFKDKEFIHDKICWADFFLWNKLHVCMELPQAWKEGDYPNLEAYMKGIEGLEKVKDYVDGRKEMLWFKEPIEIREPYPEWEPEPPSPEMFDWDNYDEDTMERRDHVALRKAHEQYGIVEEEDPIIPVGQPEEEEKKE